MPVIDGEKWACSSCIKGHRVSGCLHHDRELHHIAPKGRPVKQCEHCRTSRKSKSQHGKCDCGDKKDKDKAKDNEGVSGDLPSARDRGTLSDVSATGQHQCLCHDGAVCLCGTKRDNASRTPTSESRPQHTLQRPTLQSVKTKPRLTTTHSETTLTVFANGHHKPCHRLNNTAHTSGAPYRIPRSHTVHGTSPFAQRFAEPAAKRRSWEHIAKPQTSFSDFSLPGENAFAGYGSKDIAHMSSDSLPLTVDSSLSSPAKMPEFQVSNSAKTQKLDDIGILPDNSYGDMPYSRVPVDSLSTQWQLKVSAMSSLNYGNGDYSTSPSGDYLLSPDTDWSFHYAGIDSHFSAVDLPLVPNRDFSSLSQPASYSGESNRHSLPAMTATSSGTQSEIGESSIFDNHDLTKRQSHRSEHYSLDDVFETQSPASYRLSSSSLSNVYPVHQVPGPSHGKKTSLDLDYAMHGPQLYGPTSGDVLNMRLVQIPKSIGEEKVHATAVPSYGEQTVSALYDTSASTPFGGAGSIPADSPVDSRIDSWGSALYPFDTTSTGTGSSGPVENELFVNTFVSNDGLTEYSPKRDKIKSEWL